MNIFLVWIIFLNLAEKQQATVTSSAATISSSCPEGHRPYRNSCYLTSFEDTNPVGSKTWHEARKYCLDLSEKYSSYDYDLVSLRDKDEYEFLLNTEWSEVYKEWGIEKKMFHIWIGLNDILSEGRWKWSDCSKLDYAKPINRSLPNPPWMPGEPNAIDWVSKRLITSIYNIGKW